MITDEQLSEWEQVAYNQVEDVNHVDIIMTLIAEVRRLHKYMASQEVAYQMKCREGEVMAKLLAKGLALNAEGMQWIDYLKSNLPADDDDPILK